MTGVAWLFDGRALRRYLPADILAIVVFLIAGEIHHGIDPVDTPLYVAETIAPFFVAWVVAAPVLGAYAAVTVDRPRLAPVFGVVAWLGANVVGQALRSSTLFHGGSSPVFVAVIGVGGVVAIGGVRAVVVWRDMESS